MTGMLKGLFLVFLLDQAYGLKTCRVYQPHEYSDHTTYVRCSNSEYCCDKGCCRKVYTIWYFWTLLLFVLFVSIIFCWWYKARQRQQQIQVLQRTVMPMQVIQPYQQRVFKHSNQPVEVHPYPAYPYPYGAPPPYSIAVNTAPPPNQMHQPPNQMHQPPNQMHQPPNQMHQPPNQMHQPPNQMQPPAPVPPVAVVLKP